MPFIFIINRGLPSNMSNASVSLTIVRKSVFAKESAHIDLHTKTLKLVFIEISRKTLLCLVSTLFSS